jgi:diacylglycerol kinase family enzyme
MRCTETFLPLRVRIVFGMLAAFSLVSACAAKDYLTITSPSGATVEIDGIIVGKTPYKAEVPSA